MTVVEVPKIAVVQLHLTLASTAVAVECSEIPPRASAPTAIGIRMATWARPLGLEVRLVPAQSASSTAAILTASQIKAPALHRMDP